MWWQQQQLLQQQEGLQWQWNRDVEKDEEEHTEQWIEGTQFGEQFLSMLCHL